MLCTSGDKIAQSKKTEDGKIPCHPNQSYKTQISGLLRQVFLY